MISDDTMVVEFPCSFNDSNQPWSGISMLAVGFPDLADVPSVFLRITNSVDTTSVRTDPMIARGALQVECQYTAAEMGLELTMSEAVRLRDHLSALIEADEKEAAEQDASPQPKELQQ